MAISDSQKRALEAAGYKLGKSGKTVLNAKGESVGGINENGKIWSGSSKVKDILKSTPTEAPSKPAASRGGSSRPASATPSSARPKARPAKKDYVSSGRGSGEKEVARRQADSEKPKSKAATTAAAATLIPAVGKASKGGRARTPTQGQPYNPSYSSKAKMAEGPQGRYATGVGRPAASGRGAAIGMSSPSARLARRGGGRGVMAMPDAKERLMLFNKGGLIKKK